MSLCRRCREGKHLHDQAPTGADAGCPFVVIEGPTSNRGNECQCRVVMPPATPERCPTCGRAS